MKFQLTLRIKIFKYLYISTNNVIITSFYLSLWQVEDVVQNQFLASYENGSSYSNALACALHEGE